MRYIMNMWINGLIFFLFFVIMSNIAVGAVIDIPNPIGAGDIPTLIDQIATWLLGIGTVLATIVVLWAAFLFMTSGGNADRVTRARQTLWYAVIGLTILLLASGVALLIKNTLSGRF